MLRGDAGASSSSADGYSGRTGVGRRALMACVVRGEALGTGLRRSGVAHRSRRRPVHPRTSNHALRGHPSSENNEAGRSRSVGADARVNPGRSRQRCTDRGISGRRMAPQGEHGGPTRGGTRGSPLVIGVWKKATSIGGQFDATQQRPSPHARTTSESVGRECPGPTRYACPDGRNPSRNHPVSTSPSSVANVTHFRDERGG